MGRAHGAPPQRQDSAAGGHTPVVKVPTCRIGNGDGLLLRRHCIPPAQTKAQVRGGFRPRPGDRRQQLPHVFRTDKPLTPRPDGISAGQVPGGTIRATRRLRVAMHTPRGYMRRASDRQTCWSEALFAGWQVQDSNLRRHTATDLQNDAAHAVTCGFTAPPPNFGTNSPRSNAAARACDLQATDSK